MSPTTAFNVVHVQHREKHATQTGQSSKGVREGQRVKETFSWTSVINDDSSEVRKILELPQIQTQNHSDPTSDCTSITALWSLVLDWRQQTVYECHFFFLKQKKRARGGYGVRIEAGEGDRMGCFCQQSSGHRVHSALNMSCSGGADRDLQTGCRQEQREGRRSIRCDVLGPTVRITTTGAKAPLPSLLNRTAPRSSIYF